MFSRLFFSKITIRQGHNENLLATEREKKISSIFCLWLRLQATHKISSSLQGFDVFFFVTINIVCGGEVVV